MAETISIALLAANARFSLRMRPEAAASHRCDDRLQLNIPVNRCVLADGVTVARLGPDEWLMLGPDAESPALPHEINRALSGQFFSLVDIGHRNTGIATAGQYAREVINGGCPLDLRDAAFPPGSATRTILGKAEIILLRPGTDPTYRIECWRSFAPYVYRFLCENAREFTG